MDQVMELRIKPRRLGIRHAENSGQKTGGINMKQITVVLALMCALSAYVSYPSANVSVSGETMSPLAMAMQESRSLPI
jgi:tRNA A37 threonylcarbamoyladenosine synthetase subunit TsaC/SUA5/YrdC